jgi:Uma2 family endonuclease
MLGEACEAPGERGVVMPKALPQIEIKPVVLRLWPVVKLTDDQLYELCLLNRDWRIERTAQGELLIMPPTGGETGAQNSELAVQLGLWAKQDKTGLAFDSSTGFRLPNGAMRSPDAAWVRRARLAALTREQKQKFLPLCPNFVIELRSPTDSLSAVQAKMQEYIENGAQLGWLIDPQEKRVHIYRPQSQPECLENPSMIAGDPILPGFLLDLQPIWQPDF